MYYYHSILIPPKATDVTYSFNSNCMGRTPHYGVGWEFSLRIYMYVLVMGDSILKYLILQYHVWNFWYRVMSKYWYQYYSHHTSILTWHTHLTKHFPLSFHIFNWICIKFDVMCIMHMRIIKYQYHTRYHQYWFLNYSVSYPNENYWYHPPLVCMYVSYMISYVLCWVSK